MCNVSSEGQGLPVSKSLLVRAVPLELFESLSVFRLAQLTVVWSFWFMRLCTNLIYYMVFCCSIFGDAGEPMVSERIQ